jgi:hypothetical protein
LTADQLGEPALHATWHASQRHSPYFQSGASLARKPANPLPPLDYTPADEPVQATLLKKTPKKISTLEQEIAIVRAHHEHIAKGIELFWGHGDCVEYLHKLILNGGDGVRNTRSGFKHEVAEAILNLIAMASPKPEKTPSPRRPV